MGVGGGWCEEVEEILQQIEEGGPGAEVEGGERREEESRELRVHDASSSALGPPLTAVQLSLLHITALRLPAKKITLFVYRRTVPLIPVALQ